MDEGERPRVWCKVLDPGSLADDDVRSVTCQGRALCVVRAGGRLAALDDACPHQGAPLGDGWVEEGLLICPRHAWAFDPFSGTLAGGAHQEITTYAVEERADGVYVEVPPAKATAG
ncbi:MAG: Rieske 2Fe-2S domain-containing protein [Myxococcales bacterium]|nr:Rieske 2Fe-2S domain-containing protein [Myxococcales bacterium]